MVEINLQEGWLETDEFGRISLESSSEVRDSWREKSDEIEQAYNRVRNDIIKDITSLDTGHLKKTSIPMLHDTVGLEIKYVTQMLEFSISMLEELVKSEVLDTQEFSREHLLGLINIIGTSINSSESVIDLYMSRSHRDLSDKIQNRIDDETRKRDGKQLVPIAKALYQAQNEANSRLKPLYQPGGTVISTSMELESLADRLRDSVSGISDEIDNSLTELEDDIIDMKDIGVKLFKFFNREWKDYLEQTTPEKSEQQGQAEESEQKVRREIQNEPAAAQRQSRENLGNLTYRVYGSLYREDQLDEITPERPPNKKQARILEEGNIGIGQTIQTSFKTERLAGVKFFIIGVLMETHKGNLWVWKKQSLPEGTDVPTSENIRIQANEMQKQEFGKDLEASLQWWRSDWIDNIYGFILNRCDEILNDRFLNQFEELQQSTEELREFTAGVRQAFVQAKENGINPGEVNIQGRALRDYTREEFNQKIERVVQLLKRAADHEVES